MISDVQKRTTVTVGIPCDSFIHSVIYVHGPIIRTDPIVSHDKGFSGFVCE